MKKKFIVIIVVVIALLALIVLGVYFFREKPMQVAQKLLQNQVTHPLCLGDDEVANYKINKKGVIGADVTIDIANKTDNAVIFSFNINGIFKSAHPIELYRCGVYVMRMFNYDVDKIKQDQGYKDELWVYDYSGKGKSLVLFSEEAKEFISYYALAFRVDPTETYIALIQGKSWEPEGYGYVIKNQQTYKDSFVLLYPAILKMNPDLEGYLDLEGWTKSGSYFWGNIFAGAPRFGFVRIERDSWEVDALPAPEDVLGGDALNLENGYITVHPGNVWFGIAEFTEEEKEKRRKQAIGTELYIYNLFTQERRFVIKTDEPIWYFKPKWISDTELEYEMPSGEKKIYKINPPI